MRCSNSMKWVGSTPLKAGSFVVHPAFGHHYDGAKDEEAIVQPVKTVQLEPGAGNQR